MVRGLSRLWPLLLLGTAHGWATATPKGATEPPELLWYLSRSVSGSIQEGPLKGRGFMDQILQTVIQPALPGYRHRLVSAPPARWAHDALRLPNACHPTLRKTPERLAQYAMSEAYFRLLPVGMVVRRKELGALAAWRNSAGALQLDRLLDERPLVVGVEISRTHGEGIDGPLERHPAQTYRLSNVEAVPPLMRMLALGRVDLVPAFGSDLYYLEIQEPRVKGELAWLPVEGQPASMLTHVACSNSALGRQVIETLNAAFTRGTARRRAQQLYEERLPTSERRLLERTRQETRPAERFWQDGSP